MALGLLKYFTVELEEARVAVECHTHGSIHTEKANFVIITFVSYLLVKGLPQASRVSVWVAVQTPGRRFYATTPVHVVAPL